MRANHLALVPALWASTLSAGPQFFSPLWWTTQVTDWPRANINQLWETAVLFGVHLTRVVWRIGTRASMCSCSCWGPVLVCVHFWVKLSRFADTLGRPQLPFGWPTIHTVANGGRLTEVSSGQASASVHLAHSEDHHAKCTKCV